MINWNVENNYHTAFLGDYILSVEYTEMDYRWRLSKYLSADKVNSIKKNYKPTLDEAKAAAEQAYYKYISK